MRRNIWGESLGIVIGVIFLLGISDNVQGEETSKFTPVLDGLVSWWRFDEGSGDKALDSQGKNDGEIHGVKWTKGKIGNALQFNGIEFSDYVKIPHSPSLNITDAITIEAWFNVTTVTDEAEAIVMKSNNNWTGGPYLLDLYNTGIAGLIGTDQSAWNGLVPNIWHHGAMTYDGSQIKVYLNGKLMDTKSRSGKIPTNEHDLYIGACLEGGGKFPTWNFHGIIDEVRIYKRALTQKEIMYNFEGKPGMVDDNTKASNAGVILYDGFEDENINNWKGYTSEAPNIFEPSVTSQNVKFGKFVILGQTDQGTCHLQREIDFTEDKSVLSFWYYLEPRSYDPKSPNQIEVGTISESEGQAWYSLLIPCIAGRWAEAKVTLTDIQYGGGGTGTHNGLRGDHITLISIGAAFNGAKFILDNVKVENGPQKKAGKEGSFIIDNTKLWGQFNLGAGTREPDHMGHIPYLYWFGELYFFGQQPFDSLFQNGWKLSPTGGGDIYGIGFRWARPLEPGYEYKFYLSFETFPDFIVIDDNKVWNYKDGEIMGNYAVISYTPSGKGEGMFWCIRDKNSPIIGKLSLVFSQDYYALVGNSLAFCMREALEKGKVPKYEVWNPPYKVWRSEKIYSRFHYLRHIPVKYDKPPLKHPPYPTDEVIFLERDAWNTKLSEFNRVLSDSGINGPIGHSLDLTIANVASIYNKTNFKEYGYAFDSVGIMCASPGQYLIKSGAEGWGPAEEGQIQKWYKNSIEVANFVTEEIPGSKAYIFYAEDDSPSVLFLRQYTEYKKANIFVRWKKLFEVYGAWKKKIWSELKHPERCFLLNMSSNGLYPPAYIYKNGADIAAYKNTLYQNNELEIANGRGGARAYQKRFGSNYDFWTGMYQSTHTPEEFEQILYLYYFSGADFISPEEFRFFYDDQIGGPNKYGVVYLDASRFMKTHPKRGEQVVKIGIVRGFGDTWAWVPSGITGMDCGGNNTYIRMTLPLFESEYAYPSDPSYQEVRSTQLDYNLLTVLFPDYGNYRKSNLERFCTGTPYGPVDMLPWDTSLSHLKTFDILIYMGINAMDSQQWDNIKEYVKSGGKVVIAEGQLLKEGDEPRELFTGDLEEVLGVRILTQNNAPSLMDKEKEIAFKIGNEHFKGKVSSYYQVEPAGCEVVAQTVDGAPIVMRKVYGRGEIYFYATRYMNNVSENANIDFLKQILEDTDIKILEFNPATSWIEYTVQKKKGTYILALFNHGRMKFPSNTGKDQGIWRGRVAFNLNKVNISDKNLEAFIVNPENFHLTPLPITIEKDKVLIDLEVDKRTELIIGPKGKVEKQFFWGE